MAKKNSQQINDLIFKELIKRGYSLEGNTRIWNIADSKLWYLTPEQAQAYLDLENEVTYKEDVGRDQVEKLLKENIEEISKRIGKDPINIIDLGCGDGMKAASLVRKLRKINPSLKIRYCPIDISGYMVKKAIETFSKTKVDEVIEFQYNISDFENLDNIIPLLRNDIYKKNLILLFGNTLGNFEIHELLYEIRSIMKGDDLFLIDNSINDNKQKERAKAYKENQKSVDWLIKIPLQLGLKEDEIEMGVRWKNYRLEGYWSLKCDKEIKFQDKKVQFNKGDQIIVIVAYKYNLDDLKSFLNIHFDIVDIKVSEDNSKILALCKK